MNVKFSDFFNVNLYDLGKAAIITAITSILSALFQTFQDGKLPTVEEWKAAALVGLTAGVSYVIKNLLTSAPKVVEIDPKKTMVISKKSKKVLVHEGQVNTAVE